VADPIHLLEALKSRPIFMVTGFFEMYHPDKPGIGLYFFAFKSSGIPFDYFFTISPHMLKVLFVLADFSNCERSELSFSINLSTN
jgi:hypothetical protein